MEQNKKIETLHKWIRECKTTPHTGGSNLGDNASKGGLVFFGGAGVSTESGIPDFRSEDGLYNQKTKYPFPPEVMISRSFFDAHPSEFYDYYCDQMLALDAKPNQAHRKLAALERDGICSAVITQNIDGLHQAAGSKNVIELHGSVHRNFCMRCGKQFNVQEMLAAKTAADGGVPRCDCGGIIKPDVVLYEEALSQDALEAALDAIANARMLIVAGTSLAVYPAAGLLRYFNGNHLVIVNRNPTPADNKADLCIHANVGDVLNF